MEKNNKDEKKNQNEKKSIMKIINRFLKSPLGLAIVSILSAVLGSMAGGYYENKTTENEITKKIEEELKIYSENDSLAQLIDEIKKDRDKKDETIKEKEGEIANLNVELSKSDTLGTQLETEKKKNEKLEGLLDEYHFLTPTLKIDGTSASMDEGDLLIHNGDYYYGSSILEHFFAEGNIEYKDEENTLLFSTEGGILPVIPTLENGVNLLSMDTTHKGSYIDIKGIMDNNDVQHNEAVCITYYNDYIEFRLDKDYKWFKCNAFVPKDATKFSYDSGVWNRASISITADNGVHLWGTDAISRDAAQQESPVIDISGVKYIRITFSNADENGIPILAIGEPRLFEKY